MNIGFFTGLLVGMAVMFSSFLLMYFAFDKVMADKLEMTNRLARYLNEQEDKNEKTKK